MRFPSSSYSFPYSNLKILMVSLPILWVILALAQFYNTWVQFKIFKFEYGKEYDEDGNLIVRGEEKALDSTMTERMERDISPEEADQSSSQESCKNSNENVTKDLASESA